ncbi:MAG: hypothetical protein QOH79_518 [Acidimicrobiaceae bacterium]
MASVSKRKNGKWLARYRETPRGAQKYKQFDRKIDAERWLSTITADLARGLYVDPAAGKIEFETFAESWRKAQVHRPGTVAQVETYLRRHAHPTFGKRHLSSVRPSEIQAWVKSLEGALAPSSTELAYRYVAAVFKAAVADRLIAFSPCVGIRLPKIDRPQVEPLAVEAVDALRAALPDRYAALVVLAAGTGLRQGECFGVTLDRIDFLRRTLRVDRQIVLIPHGGPEFGPVKTKASNRTIPLPDVVLDALSAHIAKFSPNDDGLVFTTPHGFAIRRTRFGEIWRTAVAAAEVPTGTGFHGLRHFYASLLIRSGCSVKVVQARLGHANAAETLDTYSHLWPDDEDRTRQAIDDVLGRACEDLAAAT